MSWKFYALASACFAGLTAVLAKIGLVSISSNMATFIRTCVILIFLFFLVILRREWVNPLMLNQRSLIFLILSGMATGLSWICFYRALQTGPASLVVPIDKLSLIFTIVLALLFLGEQLTWVQWVGAIFMSTGVLLMVAK
jgi:transporter family protein